MAFVTHADEVALGHYASVSVLLNEQASWAELQKDFLSILDLTRNALMILLKHHTEDVIKDERVLDLENIHNLKHLDSVPGLLQEINEKARGLQLSHAVGNPEQICMDVRVRLMVIIKALKNAR